ncbi:MAG: hypothetical protein ACI8UD_002982 [Planctomycetota bacterium]
MVAWHVACARSIASARSDRKLVTSVAIGGIRSEKNAHALVIVQAVKPARIRIVDKLRRFESVVIETPPKR